MIWDRIDAILVINLDESTERWQTMMKRLPKDLPVEKIHRISAVKGVDLPGYLESPWFSSRTGSRARTCAGAAGCVLSHAKALKYALDHEDWNVVMVLEDDVMFLEEKWRAMEVQLIHLIYGDSSWDLLYPGYHGSPRWAGELDADGTCFNIYKCSGVLGTFAMLLHRRAWGHILRRLPDERSVWSWIAQYKAIDYWLERWYAPFHQVLYMTPAPLVCDAGLVSDISGKTSLPVKRGAPSGYLTHAQWNRYFNILRRVGKKVNLQCDRLIRWLNVRVRGYSGGARFVSAGVDQDAEEVSQSWWQHVANLLERISGWPGICLWLMSLCLTLIFNIYVFQEDEVEWLSWAGSFSSSLLLTLICMLSLKIRLFGFVVLPITCLLTFVIYYIFSIFGSYVNFEIIASILETNVQEALPYCSWSNISMVTLVLGLSSLFVYYGNRHLAKKIRWIHIASYILLYAISLLCFMPAAEIISRRGGNFAYYKESLYWPFGDIKSNYKRVKEYIKKGGQQYHDIMQLPSMAAHESHCSLGPDDELTIILHIGESVRADHLQLNGYARTTTPFLVSRRDNIVSFLHNYSFGLVTRVSIIGMLTDAEVKNRVPQYAGFVDLFNKHGYGTGTVLINPVSIHDFPLKILTSKAKKHAVIPTRTDQQQFMLGASVAKVTEMDTQLIENRKLIILYDSGAHPFFSSLPRNKKFLPDDFPVKKPLAKIENVINAYDNNIIEIDMEIHAILQTLETRNAVYIYVSDHGVALGEQGKFGQGNIAEPVKNPAFFIWMSDMFISRHRNMFLQLKNHAGYVVSHDYILHTILSLGGIYSVLQKYSLDLTSPDAVPFVVPVSADLLLQGQKNEL